MFTQLARGVLELVYPPVCRLCARLLDTQADFCLDCLGELTTDPFRSCCRCGTTVGPHIDTNDGCMQCRLERHSYDRVFRVGPYRAGLRELVVRAKSDEAIAEAAGAIFAERIGCMLARTQLDGVVAVPLHWKRDWRRGYNQSDLLARKLAARIGLKWHRRLLRRTRSTPKQTALTEAARRQNVKGVFRATRRIKDCRLVLVDDVLTTGATADAAASALKQAGAASVIVAVLAHG